MTWTQVMDGIRLVASILKAMLPSARTYQFLLLPVAARAFLCDSVSTSVTQKVQSSAGF